MPDEGRGTSPKEWQADRALSAGNPSAFDRWAVGLQALRGGRWAERGAIFCRLTISGSPQKIAPAVAREGGRAPSSP